METKYKRIKAIVLVCIFSLSALICLHMQTYASIKNSTDGKVKIRVAFYQLDGFFEYDENGNECGYGVDYLNELSKYQNIEWEYVPVSSWEDIGPMMRAGQVDVRVPVSEPSQPSTLYSYTTEDILSSYHAIMTLKLKDNLFYQDYDTISTLKIAVTDGLVEKTGLEDYIDSIGISEENLVTYDDYNACKKALEDGIVDALMSNVMDLTDEMKILDKFAVTKNYITTLKNSPFYSIINSAMTELELNNPSFQTDLYESYYPERTVEPFTKEETEYISQTDSLKVGVYTNRKPVSYYDEVTKSFEGIAIDLAEELSKKIGISFEYVPITTDDITDMFDSVDLIMPVTKSVESDELFTTTSLFDSEIMVAVKKGNESPGSGAKVGVLKETVGIRKILESTNKNFDIVTYDSNKEALSALQKGNIDAFANASYVLNWWLESPRYEDLSLLRYKSLPLDYLICGKETDSALKTILNKGISSISQNTRTEIINENSNYTMSDMSLSDRLYVYRYEITLVMVILVIVILAIMVYNHSRTRYIEEIKEKSKAQEEANQAKSAFLSRMSHDMRTPMNAIIGISYLGMNSDEIEKLKDYHKKINQSGKYLLGLINDTLDMSKIDNGKMELHDAPFLINDLLENIQVIFKDKLDRKHIELSVISNVPLERAIISDELRLEQLFVNLINNAIKFSKPGEIVEFHIHEDDVSQSEISYTFIVKDYGCGMTKDFQKKMYEPFEQEERVDADVETGTGLGLSIVKKIVDIMKGTISCESEMRRGTAFVVRMKVPIYTGNIESIREKNDEPDPHKITGSLVGKHILLVEDHPLNTEIAKQLLIQQGMIVDTAENGQVGVDRFIMSKENDYDAILMDIRMPVLDGLQATKAIRNLNRLDATTIPIIAMTANAFEEDRRKSEEAGMNAHLAKPIDVKELYGTLLELLSKSTN